MATLYKVGTGNFNAVSWATSSGGTATNTPTAADDCIVDGNSGSFTINAGSVCRSLTINGFTNTMTHGTALTLTIGDTATGAGNVALNIVTTGWTYTLVNASTSSITFASTSTAQQTIRTNGKTLGSVTINGVGSSYILVDPLVASGGVFTLTNGTFDTGSFNCESLTFASTANNARTFSAGTTNWSILSTAAAAVVNFSNTGTLVLGASNMTWTILNASANTRTFAGASSAHGTINYSVAASSGTLAITGANSFNDIVCNPASGARTITLSGNQTIRAFTGLNNLRGAAGSLVTLTSNAGGTSRIIFKSNGGQVSTDYLSVQDITFSAPYTFYVGANSTNVSNNVNVIFSAPPSAPLLRQIASPGQMATDTQNVVPIGFSPVSGNLLVYMLGFIGDPGSLTDPVGWTLAAFKSQGTNTFVYVWYKVSSGAESSVQSSWSNTRVATGVLYEVGGFSGVPTLDVTDSNGSTAAMSLSTGAGVSNSVSPAIGLAIITGNGGLGTSTSSPTNSYQEDYTLGLGSAGVSAKFAVLPITSTASQSTTFSWSTGRVPAAILTVFKGGSATNLGNFFELF